MDQLEITGGDLDADKVVWDVHDVQKVYDGTPLSAYVAKATDKFGNALKVEYSTDGEQWTDDPSRYHADPFRRSAGDAARDESQLRC